MTGAEAGITRDAIAAHWVYKDREFRLVDTAGMRKKAKVHNSIERLSVDDTLRAIRLAQVVVLVIDANSPLEKQDLSIADHILQEGRALIIAINKWDTIEDKKGTLDAIQYRLQHGLAQVENIPLVAMSALTGKNIHKIMDHALSIYKIWSSRVRTGGLNRWLRGMESRHPAPMVHGRPNRLRYIAQIKTKPPTFIVWCSRPDDLPETYKRYLMNHLRKDFDLNGIPLRIIARTSKNPYVK
jgi:GTP-binding protein